MHLVKSLLDKPLISVNEGRIIGTSKTILFAPDWKSVTAVSLGAEGSLNRTAQSLLQSAANLGAERLFNLKTSVIIQSEVALFGVDALFIRQTGVAIDSAQIPDFATWLKRDDLKGRAIETPGGTKIGTVGDIIINPQGQVMGFKLGHVLVQGTLANRGYISRDCVVELLTSTGLMTIDLAQAEQQILTDGQQKIDLNKLTTEESA